MKRRRYGAMSVLALMLMICGGCQRPTLELDPFILSGALVVFFGSLMGPMLLSLCANNGRHLVKSPTLLLACVLGLTSLLISVAGMLEVPERERGLAVFLSGGMAAVMSALTQLCWMLFERTRSAVRWHMLTPMLAYVALYLVPASLLWIGVIEVAPVDDIALLALCFLLLCVGMSATGLMSVACLIRIGRDRKLTELNEPSDRFSRARQTSMIFE